MYGKGFIPGIQNYLDSKDCIFKIQAAVKMYMGMIGSMLGGIELKNSLAIAPDKFMLRWTAD